MSALPALHRAILRVLQDAHVVYGEGGEARTEASRLVALVSAKFAPAEVAAIDAYLGHLTPEEFEVVTSGGAAEQEALCAPEFVHAVLRIAFDEGSAENGLGLVLDDLNTERLRLADDHRRFAREAQARLRGKRARHRRGDYQGRDAIIDQVHVDVEGRISVRAVPLRRDGKPGLITSIRSCAWTDIDHLEITCPR